MVIFLLSLVQINPRSLLNLEYSAPRGLCNSVQHFMNRQCCQYDKIIQS
uniref:Uncharacterized protein n=1 Tax=Anguilla anguilla TaxID=7936 RepID=A0A0E9Q480_ANGAN